MFNIYFKFINLLISYGIKKRLMLCLLEFLLIFKYATGNKNELKKFQKRVKIIILDL